MDMHVNESFIAACATCYRHLPGLGSPSAIPEVDNDAQSTIAKLYCRKRHPRRNESENSKDFASHECSLSLVGDE